MLAAAHLFRKYGRRENLKKKLKKYFQKNPYTLNEFKYVRHYNITTFRTYITSPGTLEKGDSLIYIENQFLS